VPEKAVLLGLLAAYAFHAMFVFDNLMSAAYFYAIVAFAHGLSWRPLPRFMLLSKPASNRTIAVVAPIVAIIVIGGGWYFNAGGIARAQTMIDAISTTDPRTGAPKAPQENIAAFKAALSQGELGKQEVAEQLMQYAANADSSSSFNPELKQEVYTLAHDAGTAMLAERPNDARLESFMGVLLAQYGQYDEAIAHLRHAVELSPNKQTLLFQLGQAYMQKGDMQEALPVLKKAFDLAPEYDSARMLYAGALYAAGQMAAADALLTEKFGTTLVDNDQLIQIYASLHLNDRVIAIWKARVEKDPKNQDIHFGLAQAYFNAGDNKNAILELQTIAQLNPAAAAQINALIAQLQSGALKPQ
jgi:tetratricopeptide (TPR) repeat protein